MLLYICFLQARSPNAGVFLKLFVLVSPAPGILAHRAALSRHAAENRLHIRRQKLVVLDFQHLHRVVEDRIGGDRRIEHGGLIQTGANLLVKRDAHFLGGVELTVEVQLRERFDIVNKLMDTEGVHNATLIACQSEAGN